MPVPRIRALHFGAIAVKTSFSCLTSFLANQDAGLPRDFLLGPQDGYKRRKAESAPELPESCRSEF